MQKHCVDHIIRGLSLIFYDLRCRWAVEGSQSGIQYDPFPVPQHGLPVRFWEESNNLKQDMWASN